ncbi:DUF625-domain-containing protein [Pseudovirgaria hyperparasitica]|uniref:DUF625-domain-containing protein n=1 Tax=Pseudovirgaria hyperparasitica TaxID=470096 RepID=A0A6A6WMR3_9PEZI|nr:DUF625-domain-containing protein [Pseudovirgaria hyperparasitica]KAF2763504.1 DUF625-domain-containing protein [Pseudovirgaria hyperparasitica]
MALAAPPGNDRKRVKVYELKNNDWFDRGTGFCTGQQASVSPDLVVATRDRFCAKAKALFLCDLMVLTGTQDEARIFVQSEDEPTRVLLETKITKDDGYQKQQGKNTYSARITKTHPLTRFSADTLIVWTEQNGTDMALSFQEAEGCGQIWEFVSQEQQRLAQLLGPDDGLSDDIIDNPIMLPPPDLENLPEVENAMRHANTTQAGRDALTKFIMTDDYIRKLVPLVEDAEDLESLSDLHRLCNMMKLLILLNDTAIIEHVVTDDVVLGVVGALEYDPDFPCHKANHRQYLSDESRFKEVVKIDNIEIRKKIHYTYRLQYLKDVVLARILDDPTFSVLNSLIFFHQVDIVQHLQGNTQFLKELFGIFQSPDVEPQRKKDAVLFIQQCSAVAKSLQVNVRQQLYSNFVAGGLFNVVTFALRHPDASVRVAGTDILVALIDHDAISMRAQIFTAVREKQKPITDVLIELLLVETDLGVKHQMADAIKILLDPNANLASLGRNGEQSGNNEFFARMQSRAIVNPQADSFVQSFYDESARKLFKPLKDLEHRETLNDMTVNDFYLYSHLLEVMNFFLRQYFNRSKYIFLQDNIPARVAQLLRCPEKHLKLSALKFFRVCLGLQDGNYAQHIIDQRLFEPILDLLFETMPRDNLLNSACLEIFEYVRREARKEVLTHLVENYREKLLSITYVDTFHNLIARYEQMILGPRPEEGQSFPSQETASLTPDNRNHVNGGRWQGLKEQDQEEESYFNSSDGDEDEDPLAHHPSKPVNGASPVRPLVSYREEDDDDDDDMDMLAIDPADRSPKPSSSDSSSAASQPQPSTDGIPTLPSQTNATVPSTPPERLAEKRRREEDEEDELGKLTTPKSRKSSFGSTASISSTISSNSNGGHRLRKKSISTGKDGPPKKIAISLAVKSNGSTDSENGGD